MERTNNNKKFWINKMMKTYRRELDHVNRNYSNALQKANDCLGQNDYEGFMKSMIEVREWKAKLIEMTKDLNEINGYYKVNFEGATI